MNKAIYRYAFSPDIPTEEAEASLLLALWGVQSLHGECQARLDAMHCFDAAQRACVIDATTPVGRDLNRLFIGFLRREFGDADFRVERVTNPDRLPATCPEPVS